MKMNPVYKREITVSNRSFRLPLILLIFNGVLAGIVLLNMYSVIEQAKLIADIQYGIFFDLYILVTLVEFILLMFILPAIASGSISAERESQTLELVLTTSMKSWEIVYGKLIAILSTMFIIIISSMPILFLIFIFGGVRVIDMGMLLVSYGVIGVLCSCIGIFFSAFVKRTTIATAMTYGMLLLLSVGTYFINQFVRSISHGNFDRYVADFTRVSEQANINGFFYLLLFNPVTTFHIMVSSQVGEFSVVENLSQWYGTVPSNLVTNYWVLWSLLAQLLLAGILFCFATKFSKKNW